MIKKLYQRNLVAAQEQSRNDPVHFRVGDNEHIFPPDGALSGDVAELSEVGGLPYVFSAKKGTRHETMEDYFGACEVPQLPCDKAPKAFTKVFHSIQREIERRALCGGAPATALYCDANQMVTVASAGDTRAVAAFRQVSTGHVDVYRLSLDHRLDDKRELKRVRTAGGTVRYDEHGPYIESLDTRGKLRPPRGFGDLQYKRLHERPTHERFGVTGFIRKIFGLKDKESPQGGLTHQGGPTHVPDITQMDLRKKVYDSDWEVTCIVGSDGFFEYLHEKTLGEIIAHESKPGEKMPITKEFFKLLTDIAVLMGTKDDVSVGMVRLAREQKAPILMKIFDGHGGTAVPELALGLMPQFLQQEAERIAVAESGKLAASPDLALSA